MRILHVIPSVAPRYGGPSAAIGPMCRALAEAGLSAAIASTDADGPGRLAVPLGRWTTWDGVPTMFFRRDASESFKYSRGLSRWLRDRVADYDVVHVHAVLSHAPLAAAAACRRAGVPYVVRPLGTIAGWSLGRRSWRKQVLLSLAGRRMLRGAAAVHCTSDDEREDAQRMFGLDQTVVIPLGIDPELFEASAGVVAERASRPYVLALSRLHPKKNFDLLIDAFLDARERLGGGWHLVIAGAGDEVYAGRLRDLVAARGAGDIVSFAGWVDGQAKRALIARASLFALPSRHENFGVAVLEAMAAGVPVVVSRDVHLGPAISAAQAGWVVDGTRSAVAGALAEAMADGSKRDDAGRAAKTLAARFTWPAIAKEMSALYERLASSAAHQTRAGLAVTASR